MQHLTVVQSTLEPQQHYAHPALTRYFDHLQSRPPVRESAASISPPFDLVSFDLENAPKIERKAEPPKKKDKKPGQNTQASQPAAAVPAEKAGPPASASDSVPEKKDKKEKKEKKAKEAADGPMKKKGANAGAKAAEPEDAGEPVPSMIDLRVGRIVDGQSILNLLIYN